jgi:hypothetical protein
MHLRDRVPEIRRLLETALDCDEEYLYEGEMSYYARTYAGDAVSQLRMMFASSAPTPEEINACVAEFADAERMANGKSQMVLLNLSDKSRPILDALSRSNEARLRLLALEAGGQWTNYLYYSPLYPSVDMKIRLLEDPDEEVRLAAVLAAGETMRHNMKSLGWMIEKNREHWFVELYKTFFELLDDPSPRIRAAAAEALSQWAAANSRAALIERLEKESAPAVRKILTAIIESPPDVESLQK